MPRKNTPRIVTYIQSYLLTILLITQRLMTVDSFISTFLAQLSDMGKKFWRFPPLSHHTKDKIEWHSKSRFWKFHRPQFV